jgi:hypothetical protein
MSSLHLLEVEIFAMHALAYLPPKPSYGTSALEHRPERSGVRVGPPELAREG